VCTLTIAWDAFASAPVVVAANRDELRDRPSEPPERRPVAGVAAGGRAAPTTAVAPRDARAGGTWIGANDAGVFAGLTNRWVEGLAAERTRGEIVDECLRRPTAAGAVRAVERAVEATEYDGFNLVVADAWRPGEDDPAADAGDVAADRDAPAAVLLEWDGSLRVTHLDPGVHVVVNVGCDGACAAPADRADAAARQADDARGVREALRPEPGESPDAWLARAQAVLADHDYGVCVHGSADPADPPADFGTRSSSALVLGERSRYEFADGPPCEAAFETVAEW